MAAQHWDYDTNESHEIGVDINSKGYYDPGRIGGLPENDYPPEGDEERFIVGLELFGKYLTGKELEEFLKANPGFAELVQNWAEELELERPTD